MKMTENLPRPLIISLAILFIFVLNSEPARSQLQFEVSVSPQVEPGSVTGRLLLMLSRNSEQEPRFQIMNQNNPQQVFGIDVNGLEPGEKVKFQSGIFGFPLADMSQIEDGEYYIQALLHRYEKFERSDGHTVQLPMDRGEGQRHRPTR